MTYERHIHMKNETILTGLTYFLSTSGRINPHDDSFQSESPCKPVENSQTSLKTPRKLF